MLLHFFTPSNWPFLPFLPPQASAHASAASVSCFPFILYIYIVNLHSSSRSQLNCHFLREAFIDTWSKSRLLYVLRAPCKFSSERSSSFISMGDYLICLGHYHSRGRSMRVQTVGKLLVPQLSTWLNAWTIMGTHYLLNIGWMRMSEWTTVAYGLLYILRKKERSDEGSYNQIIFSFWGMNRITKLVNGMILRTFTVRQRLYCSVRQSLLLDNV